MIPEKWKETLSNIKDNFEVLDEGVEKHDDEGGLIIEYIDFLGPLGKMKLEFVTKPVVLEKKINYSKRIGSEIDIKYVYSDDEYLHKMTAYKWSDDENDWIEIDGEMFEK